MQQRDTTEPIVILMADDDADDRVLARDAMADAPLKRLRIASRVRDGEVEIAVEDSGPGVPKGLERRIFDPFFTTKDRGLGLGLSICHQILEQHRGAIQIDSAVGRGTVVTCFLPIAR